MEAINIPCRFIIPQTTGRYRPIPKITRANAGTILMRWWSPSAPEPPARAPQLRLQLRGLQKGYLASMRVWTPSLNLVPCPRPLFQTEAVQCARVRSHT
jgi:hypothetical protein